MTSDIYTAYIEYVQGLEQVASSILVFFLNICNVLDSQNFGFRNTEETYLVQYKVMCIRRQSKKKSLWR